MNHRALLLLAAVFVFGCGPSSTEVKMNEDNNSGQSGAATLTQEGDTLRIDVALSVGNANGPQLGHIHRGRCGAIGDAIVALAAVVDGQSLTDVPTSEVTLEKLLAEPHAVNIHSHDDASVYVSCGDIR